MSPSLFQAYLLARTNDPQTSKDAAKKMVESGALNQQQQNVYNAILMWTKHADDFTTKDIASCISWCNYYKAYDICRKRFSGLANKGKIECIQINTDQIGAEGLFEKIYKRRDGCRVWRLV